MLCYYLHVLRVPYMIILVGTTVCEVPLSDNAHKHIARLIDAIDAILIRNKHTLCCMMENMWMEKKIRVNRGKEEEEIVKNSGRKNGVINR